MYDEEFRDDTAQIYEVAGTIFMLLAYIAALVLGGLICGVVFFMVYP